MNKVCYILFLISTFDYSIEEEKIIGESIIKLSSGNYLKGLKYHVSEMEEKKQTVNAFFGIPFAKPPIGKLRFAPPQPVTAWSGVKNATRKPNACWQYTFMNFDVNSPAAKIWVNNTPMDEDCLYLNIWTPSNLNTSQLENLPVMVWIFGGGFFSGSASLEVYNGLYLAALENVIVVSMQYRVGAFGFLYLGSEQSVASGNMGLLDQNLALKWVQSNIAVFGGNPKNVTIFGESAGAVSVSLHFVSPLSESLFDKMIVQSSSLFNRWAVSTKAEALDRGKAFIKACNCSNASQIKEIECIQALKPKQIVEHLFTITQALGYRRKYRLKQLKLTATPINFLDNYELYFTVALKPVIDGYFLTKCPEKLLKDKLTTKLMDQKHPKLLIGNMNNEGTFWLLYGLSLNGITFLNANGSVQLPDVKAFENTQLDMYKLIIAKFMSTNSLIPIVSAMPSVKYNFNSPELVKVTNFNTEVKFNEIRSSYEFMQRLNDLSGDMDFVCGTLQFAKAVSELPYSQVKYYNFIHKTENNYMPNWTGAMHGYEIEYHFGMPFSEYFTKTFYQFTQKEKLISRRIMKYWANFARTGNPNINPDATNTSPDWPSFNKDTEAYMELSDNDIVKYGLRKSHCEFWQNLLPSLANSFKPKNIKATDVVCQNMDAPLYNLEPLSNFIDGETNGVQRQIFKKTFFVSIILFVKIAM